MVGVGFVDGIRWRGLSGLRLAGTETLCGDVF